MNETEIPSSESTAETPVVVAAEAGPEVSVARSTTEKVKEDPLARIVPSPVVESSSDEAFQAAMTRHRAWLDSVIDPRKEALWGQRANFTGHDFSGVNLEAVDLRGAELSGAKFDGAWLRKANLAGAKMVGTSFVGTDLCDANLSRCNLTDATFEKANLRGANLKDAVIDQANFSEAQLTDAKFNQPRLQRIATAETSKAAPATTADQIFEPSSDASI
jgi:hypothetical protein